MKLSLRLTSLALASLLCSCAALDERQMHSVRAHHVEPYLVDRMKHNEPLGVSDIIELSRRHVPDEIIIHYIDRTGIRFALTRPVGEHMRANGVSVRVLQVISSESRDYVYGGPRVYVAPAPVYVAPAYVHRHHVHVY
jgi:hypothetical protein